MKKRPPTDDEIKDTMERASNGIPQRQFNAALYDQRVMKVIVDVIQDKYDIRIDEEAVILHLNGLTGQVEE